MLWTEQHQLPAPAVRQTHPQTSQQGALPGRELEGQQKHLVHLSHLTEGGPQSGGHRGHKTEGRTVDDSLQGALGGRKKVSEY